MKKKKLTGKEKNKYNKKVKKARPLGNCHKAAETLGKHFYKRSKKRLSNAQKKSLAAGRKVLKHLRTGRKVAEPLEPLLIREGQIMAGKKRKSHRKSSAKMHGFEGKRKRHTVRHVVSGRKYLHGAADGFSPKNIAVDIAGLLAGAIGVSFIASMIPVKNPKMKSLIPIIAGIAGLSFPKLAKNHFINRAALGSLAIGGYSLTKQMLPTVPLMGAADTAEGIGYAIEALPAEEKAILGILPDYSAETYGEDEYNGSAPGEMLGAVEMLEGSAPGEMLGAYPGEMLGAVEMIEGNDFE